MSTQTQRIRTHRDWGTSSIYYMAYKEYIFEKRTQFLLLYSLFTIPKKYLLPAKRKVSYMSGKLSIRVLHWIFSNHLHSHCIHCKRRGMQHRSTVSRFPELFRSKICVRSKSCFPERICGSKKNRMYVSECP